MVKIYQASLLALLVMMASLIQPAWSMDEEQEKSILSHPQSTIEQVEAQSFSMNTKRMYAPPSREQSYNYASYEPALNVFRKNMGYALTSIEELDRFKQDPYLGDLIQRKNFQETLSVSFNQAMLHHSGYYLHSIASKEEIEKDLLIYIEAMNFEPLLPIERMTFMEAIVKSGSVKAVEILTKKLCARNRIELFTYTKIMKEGGAPHDVPIFWLPAIVTRWDEEKVPDKNYREIEKYLCNILCSEGKAEVQGSVVTRDEFVNGTNEWKVKRNKELGSNRYQLPLSFVQNLTK